MTFSGLLNYRKSRWTRKCHLPNTHIFTHLWSFSAFLLMSRAIDFGMHVEAAGLAC